jgi:hypothetical protein
MEAALHIGILISLTCSAIGYGVLLLYKSMNMRASNSTETDIVNKLKHIELEQKLLMLNQEQIRHDMDYERGQEEGRVAFCAGIVIKDCPYPDDGFRFRSAEYLGWCVGWETAHIEKLTSLES